MKKGMESWDLPAPSEYQREYLNFTCALYQQMLINTNIFYGDKQEPVEGWWAAGKGRLCIHIKQTWTKHHQSSWQLH